jgi:ABC-type branched-subunit amino acid transport system substrate-binding protein
VKRYIRSAGAQVVGESFVPLGTQTHEAYLERIRAARPDIVLVSLIGTDSILFNRAFAASGLAAHILRLSSAIDETALLGIGADNAENLYSSSGFFTAVGSRASEAFQDRYQGAFGATAPVLGGVGQSSYEGFHFYAALAARAGSTALGPLAGAAEGLVYEGGRGPVSMRRHRTTMPMFLCEADGLDFRLIRTL